MTPRAIRISEVVRDDAAELLDPTPIDGRRPVFDTNSLASCDDVQFSPAHVARQMKIFVAR